MKLTREVLKSLIKEELENLSEDIVEVTPEPSTDELKEGMAFIDEVVNHIANIPNRDLILKKLKTRLNTDMPPNTVE